jgi:hypothetical protein
MKKIVFIGLIFLASCQSEPEQNYEFTVKIILKNGTSDTVKCNGPTLYLTSYGITERPCLETSLGNVVAFDVESFKILNKTLIKWN